MIFAIDGEIKKKKKQKTKLPFRTLEVLLGTE